MPDPIIPAPAATTQNKYILDYSTAARTNPVVGAVTITITITGTASTAGFGFNTALQGDRTMAAINQLIATVNTLVTDVTALKGTSAAIIADLQANNLAK